MVAVPVLAQVNAELCNVSLANVAMTGMMGIEQTREGGCNPEDCIVAYIDPIRFTVGVSIAGFNCTAIDWKIPEEEGAKLWNIYEGCENP